MAPPRRLGGRDQLLAVLLGDIPPRGSQRKGAGPDRAVLGDADRSVGAYLVDLLGLREEGVHALPGRGAVRALLVLPNHVDLLAGVALEPLLGEVAGRLRLRPGGVVVGLVLAREGAADADDHDHRGDPCEDHAAAAAVGDVGELGEKAGHSGAFPEGEQSSGAAP